MCEATRVVIQYAMINSFYLDSFSNRITTRIDTPVKFVRTHSRIMTSNGQNSAYRRERLAEDFDVDTIARIDKFVIDSTARFDSSHNHEHANAVYRNTMLIADSTGDEYDKRIVHAAAKLHDVVDHKYTNLSITNRELDAFLNTLFTVHKDLRIVMCIMNRISYSQLRNRCSMSDHKFRKYDYIDWIRDADRIEAIGPGGIERCEAYCRKLHPDADEQKITSLVVQHCKDKLWFLYGKEGNIVTPKGRELAKPLHEYIEAYMARNGVDLVYEEKRRRAINAYVEAVRSETNHPDTRITAERDINEIDPLYMPRYRQYVTKQSTSERTIEIPY